MITHLDLKTAVKRLNAVHDRMPFVGDVSVVRDINGIMAMDSLEWSSLLTGLHQHGWDFVSKLPDAYLCFRKVAEDPNPYHE